MKEYVSADVDLQTADAGVFTAAVGTRVGLLSSMCQHMALQVSLRDEALLASNEITREWPLSRLLIIQARST